MSFDTPEALVGHRATHQPTSRPKPKPIDKECPDCGKILQTAGGYFTHRKMHLEGPKYLCEICNKTFFQKVNLVNHEKTHNIQNRNYKCDLCDKSFFEKSHLQRHQNFHNESRDFQCDECLKFYKTERCLKVHKQVHSDPSNRPWKCKECKKGFLSSSKLKQHENIHTNSRPFLCKHCPRDFTNYPNLLKHTIRRHKVDHRTGKPLDKIPDYVTNKNKSKKKATEPKKRRKFEVDVDEEKVNIIRDDDNDLPSTSAFSRNHHFPNDTNYSIEYEPFSDDAILMDIDEFGDFQLLSPSNEVIESDQFSIIDTTDLQFFNDQSPMNISVSQLISSGQ